MKRIHGIGLLALFAVSFALPLWAQEATPSLGDVARQERERKQNLAANAGPADTDVVETAPIKEVSQFTFLLTQQAGGTSSMTQGFADGAKFRLEPLDTKTADNPEGTYAMSPDNGRTTYLVNPARKEFARVDAEALKDKVMVKAADLYKQAGLQIESPKVETVLTEPGEAIDGHPTRHYRVKISYSMHFLKTNVTVPYVEYQDLWMASDIGREGAPDILIYFRPTADPRIDDAWTHELAQIPGFPLRQVDLRTEVNEDGNSAVMRITRDISGVRIGPVPASLFELPESYKEVQAKEQTLPSASEKHP